MGEGTSILMVFLEILIALSMSGLVIGIWRSVFRPSERLDPQCQIVAGVKL